MQIARKSNRKTGMIMGGVALAALGLGFASVPLYRVFCQATGFNGTTQRAEGDAPGAVVGKMINVRFDANIAPHMGWKFEPSQSVMRVAVGARQMAFFDATNTTDHAITGQAVYNVSPDTVGKYFKKIQCFCFSEQTLQPGQKVDMPVVFFVDPAIEKDPDTKDVHEITLSYTFYPVETGTAAR